MRHVINSSPRDGFSEGAGEAIGVINYCNVIATMPHNYIPIKLESNLSSHGNILYARVAS